MADRKDAVIGALEGGYLSTNQIRRKTPLSYNTVRKALEDLHREGRVELERLSNARYWKLRECDILPAG